jgi:hypothetical protein
LKESEQEGINLRRWWLKWQKIIKLKRPLKEFQII